MAPLARLAKDPHSLRPRVVIVDDNPMTVRLATHVFAEDGWLTDGFTSPREALRAMETMEPDLIVCDFRMPEMSGPDFLLAASATHDLTPKLIVTAYEDDEHVRAALRKAGVPSISKMDGLTALLAEARRLVKVRQSVKLKTMVAGV